MNLTACVCVCIYEYACFVCFCAGDSASCVDLCIAFGTLFCNLQETIKVPSPVYFYLQVRDYISLTKSFEFIGFNNLTSWPCLPRCADAFSKMLKWIIIGFYLIGTISFLVITLTIINVIPSSIGKKNAFLRHFLVAYI